MFNNVLVACTGNICRSPMAEYLLKQRVDGIEVFSAGINAIVGHSAENIAIKIMKERGVDMTSHCACQMNTFLLSRADLVLVMEQSHINTLHQQFPSSRGKVFLLGKWLDGEAKEIFDPYQRGELAFRKSLQSIESGVYSWQRKIWGEESSVRQCHTYK